MMRRFALLLGLALVAGCGRSDNLKAVAGHSLPVKPATALITPSANDLLQAPTEARPTRVDDPLTKSVERPDDKFHLPPPG
jgi:hypothetical protein